MTEVVSLAMATINSALTAAAGEPVRLRQCRPISGQPTWIVEPIVRGRIVAPFWREVQRSPSGGLWDSPERAVAGFLGGVKGWVAGAAAKAPTASEFLVKHLAPGPLPAAVLYERGKADGISVTKLDRAARRLGVKRQKSSISGGWMWWLPAKGSAAAFEGCAADKGAAQ